MIRNITDLLRVEVDTDPTGLVNLIPNPSGDEGAWAWITPINQTSMSVVAGPPKALKFTAAISVACYFTSDYLPVAATHYVAARFDTIAATASHNVKVRYQWFDSDKVLLSTSTQTSGYGGTAQTNYVAAIVAPASTAYAKIRFDFYNSASNPSAGAFYTLRNVMVTTNPTNAFSTVRTNLFANPSFESSPAHWAPGSSTVARVTTTALYGTTSLRVRSLAGLGFSDAYYDNGGNGVSITGGKVYTASVYAKAATVGRSFQLALDFFTLGGTPLSGAAGTGATDNTSTWTRASVTATAPPSARYAVLTVTFLGTGTSEDHYIDGLLLEQSTTLNGYFSGSTASAGTKSYAWTGTTDASTSTESNTDFEFADPAAYLNILAPSSSISINRAPLDPGVIGVKIIDTTLDPADADTLRAGRRLRIMALNDDTGTFEALVDRYLVIKASVTYDLTKPVDKQATITVAATDSLQVLANFQRANSVGTIDELAYYLETVGIPWNFNGSGNQVPSITLTATNDQATALDQIVLTRDSDLGYAWISKEGVLNAWSDRSADYYGTGTALVDESVYSNIDVSFDADDCINEVIVILVHIVSGTTTETTYGPYRDAAAIAEWRVVRRGTFRVTGIDPNDIDDYAADVLAANSIPARRVKSVTIPIREAEDITPAKALLDLYSLVRIVNTAKGIDMTQRVTSISHAIDARSTDAKWVLVLGFGTNEIVSAPIIATGTTATATTTGTIGPAGANGTSHASLALFKFGGTIGAGAGSTRMYNDTANTWTISSIRASVESAPSGGSVVTDVNKNGTTLFTTQANRPTITTTNLTSGKVTNMDITTIAPGDYVTVDVDSTTAPAANLTVTLVIT